MFKDVRLRYRVTKPFSVAHFALVAAAVMGAVALSGLVNRLVGWGNLIIVGFLVRAAVGRYLVTRTALMVSRAGVTVDGLTVPWPDVGELVVVGPAPGGVIQVGVRRPQGSHFAAAGSVPASKFDPARLQAAFKLFALRSARLSGWGVSIPEPSPGRRPLPPQGTRVEGSVPRGDGGATLAGAERSSGTTIEPPTPAGGAGTRTGGWGGVELAYRRWEARSQWLRRVVPIMVVLLLAGAAVMLVPLVRNEPEPVADDFVGMYPSYFFPTLDTAETVSDGRLIGPHFNLAVDQVAVVDSLSAADDIERSAGRLPARVRAGDGQELVVAYLDGPRIDTLGDLMDYGEGGDIGLYAADHESEMEAWVDVGDDRRHLPGLPEPWGVIVASVPEGADVHFAIADSGRWQSVDLRTGQRQETIDAFYTSARDELDYRYSEPTRVYRRTGLLSVELEEEALDLTVERVVRDPWHAELGYSAAGRAWLNVYGTMGLYPYIEDFFLDARRAFVLVDQAGNEMTAHPDIGYDLPFAQVVFDVPADFTTGTLHVRPTAGAEILSSLYAWETPPPDATVHLRLSESPA